MYWRLISTRCLSGRLGSSVVFGAGDERRNGKDTDTLNSHGNREFPRLNANVYGAMPSGVSTCGWRCTFFNKNAIPATLDAAGMSFGAHSRSFAKIRGRSLWCRRRRVRALPNSHGNREFPRMNANVYGAMPSGVSTRGWRCTSFNKKMRYRQRSIQRECHSEHIRVHSRKFAACSCGSTNASHVEMHTDKLNRYKTMCGIRALPWLLFVFAYLLCADAAQSNRYTTGRRL